MSNDFTNYDLLDKMLANNKKAKSWTAFWVVTLCILAGAVLWMAFDISQKKETIVQQEIALQSQQEIMESKNKLIDSLHANCSGEKIAIVQSYDSAIGQTQQAIRAIITPTNTIAAGGGITDLQKEKLTNASKSLRKVRTELSDMKTLAVQSPPKIFIQYNDKNDLPKIEKLLASARLTGKYFVAPPEYINNRFPTTVKFYNLEPSADDKILLEKLGDILDFKPGDVKVQKLTNAKVKEVIEIWIGSK